MRITHTPFHRELDDVLHNSWTPRPDQSFDGAREKKVSMGTVVNSFFRGSGSQAVSSQPGEETSSVPLESVSFG